MKAVVVAALAFGSVLSVGKHPFWDIFNLALYCTNAGIQVGDLLITEHGLSRGLKERNPWGQTKMARVVLKLVAVGAAIALAFLCHTAGLHGWERIMSVVFIVPSGLALVYNLRFR